MRRKIIGVVALAILVLAGCAANKIPEGLKLEAGQSNEVKSDVIPDWVFNPKETGALTATGCVLSVNDLGSDMERGQVEALSYLASMIKVDVDTSLEIVTASGQEGGSATNITKNKSNEYLEAVYRVKADYIIIAEQKNFCVQLATKK